MDLPDLSQMIYDHRARCLADEAVRALRQNRLDDASALAAVAGAHAAIASVQEKELVKIPADIPLSVTKNPRTREVALFLRRHPDRPVSNKEIRQALGYNDVDASNALKDAAALGLATKLGHGVWQAR